MSAPIRKCWGCLREIEAPATLCDDCTRKAAAATAETASAAGPAATSKSGPAGLSRRDWMLVAAGAAGAGILTLALLTSRTVVSSEAAATAAGPASASAAPAPEVIARPKWSTENRARWVDDVRKSVAFDLAAENRVQVWTRQVQPTLVVRCVAKNIEVFVFTESAAMIEPDTDAHTVRYRLDEEPEVTERWADSTEHDGLFAPDGAAFAERLARATTLRFGFTPHNAAPVDVHFRVNGLRDLLEPAAAECAPKK